MKIFLDKIQKYGKLQLMEKFASLITKENLEGLRKLKVRDERSIVYLLNRAIQNYLHIKKVGVNANKNKN